MVLFFTMPNEAHLKILREGVDSWNEWRLASRRCDAKTPHLRFADIRSADLSLARFERADLSHADLSHADLSHADLSHADLSHADLSHADLRSADFSSANISYGNFQYANLCNANLSNANLWNADLSGATLSSANLCEANLCEADLRYAKLDHAKLISAELSGADLRHAGLSVVALGYAKLIGVDLRYADLQTADLCRADLSNADLSYAELRYADLRYADLRQADLSAANLGYADFMGSTFGRTILVGALDLREVKGLESVAHKGPSTIGIDTVFASNGEIPEAFLRGAGVPDNLIVYMGSLVGKPFDFYSCFISYSSHDQAFAERLHLDLVAKHLRCWFAPEDLKIGDRFQERIEETILLYDKLMIVLSESSVESRWVEREVNAAREREERENRTVLFPIRIDDAVMNAKQPWAADIRRSRQIGDFSEWKDHDRYQKALSRLIRDLKAGRGDLAG